MQEAIIAALYKQAGRVLTPDVARAIVEDLFADRTLECEQFAPTVWGDYTIRAEGFRAVLPELEPLHAAHWLETEKYRHGLALRPNLPAVFARERAGSLVQLTVRRHGELVGHLRLYLGESIHTMTALAEEDTLFIRSDHRGGFLVMALLRYAETVLRQLMTGEVLEIRTNSKVLHDDSGRKIDAGVLMRRLGYAHVADQYTKFLKKEAAHVR